MVREELTRIAPDVVFASIDPSDDIREAFDIDSMDVLNLVTALHNRLGIDIPELDYPKLLTIDGAVTYLVNKVNAVAQRTVT
ncbi:acyl carrier protein [Methylobacterium sp. P31]